MLRAVSRPRPRLAPVTRAMVVTAEPLSNSITIIGPARPKVLTGIWELPA